MFVFQNDLYYSSCDQAAQPLVIPQVRIENTGRRRRLSSDLTTASKYELPRDSKWEFPRNRSVDLILNYWDRQT